MTEKVHKPGDEKNAAAAKSSQAENPAPAQDAGAAAEKPDKQGRAGAIHGNPGEQPRAATAATAGQGDASAHFSSLAPYPMDWAGPANIMLSAIHGDDVPFPVKIRAGYQLAGVALGVLFPETAESIQSAARRGAGVKSSSTSASSEAVGCGPYEAGPLPFVSDEEGRRALEKVATAASANNDPSKGVRGPLAGLLTGPMAKLLLSFAWKKIEEWLSGK